MKLTITHNGTQVIIDQFEASVYSMNYEKIIWLVQETINTINNKEPQNLVSDEFKLTEWEKHPQQH
jgi:hypothetical protein